MQIGGTTLRIAILAGVVSMGFKVLL
jgi:hypothetical protein